MSQLGVKLNLSTAYHPQTDGQTERVNQCLENYLRSMLFQQPKRWTKWLPLAEYWYNTNYHSSLKTSPFKALYGYEPPQLPLGSPPRSTVEGVNEVMNERQVWISNLKEQLRRAQERMKKFADAKRSERKFNVGNWVYLKLQPYRHITVQGSSNNKLAPKYHGPFEIIAKMGPVAYELKLPPGSLIHPVFHVSQLKERVGKDQAATTSTPLIYPQLIDEEKPEGILGRRMVRRNNDFIQEILIKWKNGTEEDASWENYEDIRAKFPDFILRDKDIFKGEGVSGISQLMLVTVETIDPVNRAEEMRERIGESGQHPELRALCMEEGSHLLGSYLKSYGQMKNGSLLMGSGERDVNEKQRKETAVKDKDIGGS